MPRFVVWMDPIHVIADDSEKAVNAAIRRRLKQPSGFWVEMLKDNGAECESRRAGVKLDQIVEWTATPRIIKQEGS